MSYIEKESLLEKSKSLSGDVFAAPLIIAEIEKADEVDIVFCNECRYCDHCYPKKSIGEKPVEGFYCDVFRQWKKPNDFCSYGERRC